METAEHEQPSGAPDPSQVQGTYEALKRINENPQPLVEQVKQRMAGCLSQAVVVCQCWDGRRLHWILERDTNFLVTAKAPFNVHAWTAYMQAAADRQFGPELTKVVPETMKRLCPVDFFTELLNT